jgi:hypothetical protein
MSYKKVKKYLMNIEKENDEFGEIINKIEKYLLKKKDWILFEDILGKLIMFWDCYISNCKRYIEEGNVKCKNNNEYNCSECVIARLMPWRADWKIRCPSGKELIYKGK